MAVSVVRLNDTTNDGISDHLSSVVVDQAFIMLNFYFLLLFALCMK